MRGYFYHIFGIRKTNIGLPYNPKNVPIKYVYRPTKGVRILPE